MMNIYQSHTEALPNSCGHETPVADTPALDKGTQNMTTDLRNIGLEFTACMYGREVSYITLMSEPRGSYYDPSVRVFYAKRIEDDGTVSTITQMIPISAILVHSITPACSERVTAMAGEVVQFGKRAYHSAIVMRQQDKLA